MPTSFPLRPVRHAAIFLLSILSLHACSAPDTGPGNESGAVAGQVVNVYSTRHYDSDQRLYEAFEDETGIEVRTREAGAAQLLETMIAEGENSPADLVIAADAGTLWRFQAGGPDRADRFEEARRGDSAAPARRRRALGGPGQALSRAGL